MKSPRNIVLLLIVAFSASMLWAGPVPYKDAKAGFELAYPDDMKTWKDSEPGNHLILRAPRDGLMVFVNSNAFTEAELPKTEEALVPWVRSIYDHGDPAYRIESCAPVEVPTGKCLRTVIVMTPKSGEILICENFTFVDFIPERSHRRVWKIFAIFPKRLAAEGSAALQNIVRTVRIYNHE